MQHNIRINGVIKEIDCELGSGILDKNGREIFEGDIVKRFVRNGERHKTISHEMVVFERGVFSSERYHTLRPLDKAYYLEVAED